MSENQDKINQKVMEKLDQLSKDINELCIKMASLPELMAEKFDNRYASKRTEIAVDRIGWLVISLVITMIVGGVIYIK